MGIRRLEPSSNPADVVENPVCLSYERVLARFLQSQSEPDGMELCLLAKEMAAQRTPIAEALASNWRTARSFLRSPSDARQARCVEALAQSQRDLGEAFDQALRLEARAHMRLASAYAQKTREVKTLLDSLPAFAFMKDSDFRYAAVNQVFCEALGNRRRSSSLRRTSTCSLKSWPSGSWNETEKSCEAVPRSGMKRRWRSMDGFEPCW